MAHLVSVIVPVFNGETVIRRALDSVFAQEGADLDVIVCNDGSTDSTAAIVGEYASRVHLISQPNRGRGAARNACLARARGDLIALLDADDWWRTGKLASQIAAADRLPETGVFGGDAYVVNGSGQVYRARNGEWHVGHSGWVFPYLIRHSFLPTSTVLARRTAVDRAGIFNEALRRTQDLEWLLRLAAITPFHYSTEMLAYYDDRNWHTSDTLVETYTCMRELLKETERAFPSLASTYRHQFAKSYSDAAMTLADHHDKAGRFAEAASGYAQALEHTPRSRALRHRLALALYRAGDPQALVAYRALLDDDPYDQDARFYLGTGYLAQGADDDARALLETALYAGALYQRFPECVNNLGVALARLGERHRAQQLFQQAIGQQKFYSDAIFNLTAIETGTLASLRYTPRKVF